MARVSRGAGFDAFFRSDHYLKMGDGDRRAGPDRRLDHAGRAGPRDLHGSGSARWSPSATFRLPGPLAISVAQVDAMSGGRVELGLGAGWYDDEHTAYGIPFPPTGRALRPAGGAARDHHRAVGRRRRARRSPSTAPHYPVADSPALPKPVQQPHPPIIIGGGGPTRTPRAGGPLRRRVQPCRSRRLDDFAGRLRAGSTGPARRSAATRRRSCARPRWSCAAAPTRPRCARRAAAIGREPDELRAQRRWPARPTRWSTSCGAYADGGCHPGLPPGARPRRPRPRPPARRRGPRPAMSRPDLGTDRAKPRSGHRSRQPAKSVPRFGW